MPSRKPKPKPKPKTPAKPRPTVHAGPPLDSPPGTPRIKASFDDKLRPQLDAFAKMRDAIDERNAPLNEAIKKLTGQQSDAFKDVVAKLQPKIDYSGLFKDLTGVIDQSHESNARLAELFVTPPTTYTYRSPNQDVADELQKIGTILLTTGQHVEATAISTRALVATNEAADHRLATLVGITEKAATREASAGRRLVFLTIVLVILTVVLALPEVPHLWMDWIVPTWELIRSFSPVTFGAIALLAVIGLWRRLG